jgi:hypothetical protein
MARRVHTTVCWTASQIILICIRRPAAQHGVKGARIGGYRVHGQRLAVTPCELYWQVRRTALAIQWLLSDGCREAYGSYWNRVTEQRAERQVARVVCGEVLVSIVAGGSLIRTSAGRVLTQGPGKVVN